ncbi:helix-turn-helix domain-containing protein [Paenibacillus sp. JSM ZJ436]|uniref:helix-turn-helix domain-containing protein n=1 Tax=Paenibacillus sp. JSM ZJ436 TaxID=3376190 RepID=UPI0037B77BFD
MTGIPQYITSFPNMHTALPVHFSLNRLPAGYRAHRHDFLEFSYVVEGRGYETINGVQHPMLPGTFTFVLPYQIHELFTDPGSELVLYNCNFGMDFLLQPSPFSTGSEGLGRLIEAEGAAPYYLFDEHSAAEIKRIMTEMHKEYQGNNWGRSTRLAIKLMEALILFHRSRSKHSRSAAPAIPSQTRAAWHIIHYLQQNYTREDLTLAELSKQFAMSVSRISEVIKEKTGQHYLELLNDLRIRHAIGLMGSTEMSMTEIAHESGYGSYKTFSRIFRERQGVVPTAYRKMKMTF